MSQSTDNAERLVQRMRPVVEDIRFSNEYIGALLRDLWGLVAVQTETSSAHLLDDRDLDDTEDVDDALEDARGYSRADLLFGGNW